MSSFVVAFSFFSYFYYSLKQNSTSSGNEFAESPKKTQEKKIRREKRKRVAI